MIEGFSQEPLSDAVFARMWGKSFKEYCTIPREDLVYLRVKHVGFDGEDHQGELVCNKAIATDLLEIFERLYSAGYQIEKMRLIDDYEAIDEPSMADNNSSCFNFRYISYTTMLSKHALGVAVDINTLFNPYVKMVGDKLSIEPANAGDYVDRTRDFPHKIDENDLCCQLFIQHGFDWGGAWVTEKDYQHFELSDARIQELGLAEGFGGIS